MRKASYILLTLLGAATLVLSLVSARFAYQGPARDDRIGPVSVEELAAGRPEVATALRARRGTAAAYAAAYAALFLSIVLGPYRRGERWAWWTLLAGSLVLCAVSALRVPTIGTQAGVGATAGQLGFVVVALLLDVKRLRA